jgi:hypothetical protein
MTHKDTKIPDSIKIVPETTKDQLNQRQLLEYTNHREKLISWLLHVGKNPEKAEGYSPQILKYRCYRIDRFYRWVWEEIGGYTTEVTPEHADSFMEEVAYSDYSNTHKDNCHVENAVQMTESRARWRHVDSREAALEYGRMPG